MFCIVLIGGIIGCGKTTFVEYLRRKEKELFKTTIEENLNAFVTESGENYSSKENKVFKIAFDELCSISEQAELMHTIKGMRNFRVDLLLAAEWFINLSCGFECQVVGPLSERSQSLLEKMEDLNDFHSEVLNGIFLVEDNFYYRSMRYDWFQIARRANIGFCEVFLQCPLSTAIQRNSLRGYHIPEQKIRMMVLTMEFPDPEKYKWEKYSVLLDSSVEQESFSLKEILDVMKTAANNPAEQLLTEEKIEAQRVCSKNAIHQADKILRKLISAKISNLKSTSLNKEDLKSFVSSAISIRQKILSDIRQGCIHLSDDLLQNLKQLGIASIQEEYETLLLEHFENAWNEKCESMNLKFSHLQIRDIHTHIPS